MTRDEIIRMAREAGFIVDDESQQHQPNCIFHTWHLIDEGLERFATIVSAAERQACASMAEAFHHHQYDFTGNLELHEAIRARGEK